MPLRLPTTSALNNKEALTDYLQQWPTTIEGNLEVITLASEDIEVRCYGGFRPVVIFVVLRPTPRPGSMELEIQRGPNADWCIDDDDNFDRRQQRRRTDSAPPPVRLRRQLVGIADSPLRRWTEEIQSVASLVADHHEEQHMRSIFLDILIQLALEQPLKTPFTAAVVLMVNAQRPEITTAVLERFTKALETSIAKGEWKETKLFLKFLACIQGCLEGDGVFPVLTELFNRAADLQTASSEDVSSLKVRIL